MNRSHFIRKYENMMQNTPEWMLMRKNHIGASDAPVCMEVVKWKLNDGRFKTPRILWQEKLGILQGVTNNERTRYGNKMEEPARCLYEAMTGNLVAPDIIFHPKIEYMMASLDGITMDGKIAVEIKNCGNADHELAMSGKIPDHYYPQLQHQLEVLGHEHMHYFSHNRGRGIIVDVKRDEEYIKKMLKKEKEFWDYVKNLEEPPLHDKDFHDQDMEWLGMAKRLYDLEQIIKNTTVQADSLREKLISKSQGLNSCAGNFKLILSHRKGSIDYSSIEELKGRDLECYRKKSSPIWTLKKDP